jgi:DsbC/DsbD-like thiol-disulfide interchange protein
MVQGLGIGEQGLGFACALALMLGVTSSPRLYAAKVWISQEISLGDDAPVPSRKGHVVLLSDAVVVEAGKPQVVELRFRVDPGFHINSHTPADALLLPTTVKLDESTGIKLLGEEYPKGTAFQLGKGETLDVYQGEFRVRLQLLAALGETTLTGALHYQACDNAGCLPPRVLPVKVALSSR